MSAHTPGPWRVESRSGPRQESDRTWDVVGADGDGIAEVFWHWDRGQQLGVADANADLIAAAPDLLAACQQAWNEADVSAAIVEQLRAAIAKATGGDAAASDPTRTVPWLIQRVAELEHALGQVASGEWTTKDRTAPSVEARKAIYAQIVLGMPATEARLEERRKVVAWLRNLAEEPHRRAGSVAALHAAAVQIESGEHAT